MGEIRLGDVIDDYCVKCRRLTNHAVVSILEGAAAKVRCRTCYNDHDYRNEQAPPSKRDLKKAALFKEVLSGMSTDGAAAPAAEAAAEATVPAPAVQETSSTGKKPAKKKGAAEAS